MKYNNHKKHKENQKYKNHNNHKNQGSATLEVTLIMPVILFLMVLFITMLLGVYRQAELHSNLVVYSVESNWENCLKEHEDARRMENDDLVIYSQEDTIQFTERYKLESYIEQKKRTSDIEEKLRRWQLLGDVISK